MSRYRGGQTTTESRRISLRDLIRLGFLKKGELRQASISWSTGAGGSITIESNYPTEDGYDYPGDGVPYIILRYKITPSGEAPRDIDYRINLHKVPSNLGRGEVLYFVCPVTYKFCRVLYLAYGSPIWMSREAYRNRLYYPLQTCSKSKRSITKIWALEDRLEKLYSLRDSSTYKGRPTRRAELIDSLENEKDRADLQLLSIWSNY